MTGWSAGAALPTTGTEFEDTPIVSQAELVQRLAGGWFWLATIRPDGAPHVRPVLAAWSDPVLYVVSKDTSRKSRNLAGDSRCTLSKEASDLHVVIEGEAQQVQEADAMAAASSAFDAIYDWPTTVDGTRLDAPFGAPTSGGPPYDVYAVTPQRVYAFPVDSGTFAPTRWTV